MKPHEIVITTLACPNLIGIRQIGNTCRQVDYAIGKIFEGFIVKCEDHFGLWNDHHTKADERLFQLVYKRLCNEHPHTKVLAIKGNLTIQLQP